MNEIGTENGLSEEDLDQELRYGLDWCIGGELSSRTRNALLRWTLGYSLQGLIHVERPKTLRQLRAIPDTELLWIRNLGVTGLRALRQQIGYPPEEKE